MTCPQCKGRTLTRKPSLVISVNPRHVTILDKNARFCQACDLLIVHQDELEKALNAQFMKDKSELIDNDYQVIGTIDREEWDRRERGPLSMERLLEYLHDFKEVVTFSRKPIQR